LIIRRRAVNYTNEQVFFQWVFRILIWIFAKAYGLQKLNIGDITVNYIVKDDNPDVGFAVSVGEVTDAEGQPIEDAQLSYEIASSDDSVLAVSINEDGKSGTVHFGAPGAAAFSVQVKGPDGTVLGSGGDNFTVTTGDPAAIASVSTSFDGLTPVDEAPPA
jgi:hypothetical protein